MEQIPKGDKANKPGVKLVLETVNWGLWPFVMISRIKADWCKQSYFVGTEYNHITSYYSKKIKLEFTEQDYEKKIWYKG